MGLTEKQEESLKTDHHITVTAGAGSGKTRVLVERYVRILETEPDTSPGGILALTFTDKASAEMRARIRERIKDLLDVDPLTWTKHLMDLESCDISTIHSFCSSIVRAEPLHCGVDPDFGILTDADVVSIKNAVISDLFRIDGPVSENLRRLIVDYGTYTVMKTLKDLIFQNARTSHDMLSDDFLAMSHRFLDEAHVEKTNEALSSMDEVRSALSDIDDLGIPEGRVDSGVKLVRDIRGLLDMNGECGNDREGNMELLHRIASHRRELTTTTGAKRRTGTLGSKGVWGASFIVLRASARILFDFVHDHSDILKIITKPELAVKAGQRISDITAVYGSMIEEFGRRKRARNGLDFDDLIDLATELLRGNVNNILDRMRARYLHILVDEFQDTDPRQWKILDLIWDGGRNNVLFLVGDPKQSIYGFRSADVRLFTRASDEMKTRDDGKVVVLDLNFRSRKEIMDFVNETFRNVLSEEDGRWKVPFDPLGPDRGSGGSITGLGVIGKDQVENREGVAVARIIKRAVREGWQVVEDGIERNIGLSDIAILLPARTGFRYYEDALRSEGIRCQVYKGKGFYERQEIKDVHSLLSYLLNPIDDISLASVLRSNFFSLSDEELLRISRAQGGTLDEKLHGCGEYDHICKYLDRWIDHCMILPTFKAVANILSESTIHTTAGGRRGSGNIDKLLEWARVESERSSIYDLRDRLGRLISEKPTEGEAGSAIEEEAVSIMTVHAAKGLEWPMVVVLGMHHKGKATGGIPVNVEPDRGLAIKVADDSTGEVIATPSYRAAIESEDEREDEERKRLYYVACTRAKDHLVLSGKVPFSSDRVEEPSGMMRYFIESMDLSMEDFKIGYKQLQSVKVELIPIRSDVHGIDLDEEMKDMEEISIPVGQRVADLMGRMTSVKPVQISSPSAHRIDVGTDLKSEYPVGSDLFLSYPDISEQPRGSILGDMVHRIMEGIPMDRVLIEFGYSPEDDLAACGIVRDAVEDLTVKLDLLRDEKGLKSADYDMSEIEIAAYATTNDTELPFIGRIDRVLRMASGGYHIVDFKTGAVRSEHAEQIKIYARMLENIAGMEVHGSLIYGGSEPRIDVL